MVEVSNRYANQDLFLAADHHARLGDYVSPAEKSGKPFGRQVDAWWVAMCIGVRMGQRSPLPGQKTKFNVAGILSSDPWRITHLELLALSEEGPDVLDSPNRVIEIASEYANAGMPWLLRQMIGEAEPTLTLMNHLSEL
jgi:hypothetical protein